ncbi:PREDICTED: uncharacterized protein LOC105145174 isoform X4 [Acromyrmex echinatior]|uniref:uncharacterized protein LOC105145174 isoform X4 n=1 Tax=Acromyrmex echinatior TaxID=103372 RepID=UPI000580BD2D|nr:PREDICTED: uncharacterized protein LOC105145174 isoform X4 [Acromyrmex echinatior]
MENFVSLLSSQAAPPPSYLFQLLGSLWLELLLLRGKGVQLILNKKKKKRCVGEKRQCACVDFQPGIWLSPIS